MSIFQRKTPTPAPSADAPPGMVKVLVTCPHRDDFRGFAAGRVEWPEGETKATVTRAVFDAIVGEIERGESILTVTNLDTGQVHRPGQRTLTPEEQRAADYQKRLDDRARAKAIKEAAANEEVIRRRQAALAADAEARHRAMLEANEERRRQMEAEQVEVQRILAAEDERIRKAVLAGTERAQAAGVWFDK